MEKGQVTYDTGAGATVSPKSAFPCKVRPSEAQKRGVHYIDAGGNKINNEGEILVSGQTEEFQDRSVVFQVADVTKPLFCAAESVPAGFKTVIDDEASGGSYMEHKASGQRTALEIEDSVFVFYLWVPDGEEEEEKKDADDKAAGFTRPGQP